MRLFLISIIILNIDFIFAQTSFQKHPRVIEMERQMTKDALDFLKSRFPDYPVIVTVSIDPIFRVERQKKQGSENLPYFRIEEEEIVDEWDDPSISNSFLLNRVKKIALNVSAPGHISDDEVAEIKQSLFLNLNLIPARDSIEILKRSWGKQKEPEFDPFKYIWFGLGFFVFFFGGILLSIWTPIRQIVKVLKDGVASTKSNNADTGGVGTVVAMQNWKANAGGGQDESRKESSSATGDMRFNDPIKIQSAIALIIGQLSHSESFPCLDDMVVFDDICKEKHSLLGALLMEFPIEIREKIFSLSYGNHWLEALTKPGVIDITLYEIVHKLNRIPRTNNDLTWQKLLIYVWRLNDRRGEFLRDLDQSEAFTILYYLPKALALKTAREMYPGSWAILLDPKFQPKSISEERVKLLSEGAIKIYELRNMSQVERFKQDKDLITFLRTVDVTTEKEIYTASTKDSIIHQMRPPFYKIFEANKDDLKEFVPTIPVSDWALVLSNVNASIRKLIDVHFQKKQKIRFFELLTQFEASNMDPEVIGTVRDRLALMFNQAHEEIMLRQAMANLKLDSESSQDGDESEKAA